MMYRDGPQGGVSNRNLLIAIVLTLLMMVPYQFFVLGPMQEKERAAKAAQEQAQKVATTPGNANGPVGGAVALAPVTREQALQSGGRIPFDAPSVDGSIGLDGGVIDDLSLKNYRQTVEPGSPEVVLLKPAPTENPTYGVFGWKDATQSQVPISWTAPEGARLTKDSPVTLTYETGDGLTFTRTISVDENYMFTIVDRVANASGTERYLYPFAAVLRRGLPNDLVNYPTIHEGFVGVLDKEGKPWLYELDYKAADKGRGQSAEILAPGVSTTGGWVGITDKYWLFAVVPEQDQPVKGRFLASKLENGQTLYTADYTADLRVIPSGGAVETTHRFFSGAKRVAVLKDYEARFGIVDFDKAVDWGNFWFLTRPFFAMIAFFQNAVGNFGLAIMLTTIVVKLALFPIAYNSYKTMSKIQKLQPKMKELQERFKGDPTRAQQEIMRLYQAEKVNVATGCLPILLQIPIFYALYKVLLVTIEMRHQPFVGWIKDLAAPDPTAWVNVFGLVNWIDNPASIPVIGLVLAVGIWPILYGVTMWGVTALSPQQVADPIQRRIFQFMPVLFTVMFAAFPVGMVIYWTWSNLLTILQQYVIMRRQGVETGFDKWLARIQNRAPTPAS